ncbi:endoribonuclease YbeY [Spirochaetia bacterium]|nr:endoribonuclease YbeY [Spirochaetia bacterium]
MNRVSIQAETVPLPAWKGAAESYMLKILEYIRRDGWDLSVIFCGNAWIQELNARFRDKDEPTDVLSFFMGETADDGEGGSRYLPGDIVISLESLAENARYFKVSEDEELRRLLIHGILHLDGFDHTKNTDENGQDEPMLELQERILAELSAYHIFPQTQERL